MLVLDKHRKQLFPCSKLIARVLLNNGRAAVWQESPFTIILDRAHENLSGRQTINLDQPIETVVARPMVPQRKTAAKTVNASLSQSKLWLEWR